MKKKVCVVTWSGGTNFGTNLQAYALVEKLRLLGYDPRMKGSITGNINYLLHPMFVIDRVTNKVKQKKEIAKKTSNDVDVEKEKKFAEFCKTYLPRLNSHGKKEWEKVEEDYLAFITGSDQVWNPNYFQSMMMLDFVNTTKIKKIAYAPSIGVSTLSEKTRKKYRKLLSSYSAIGMREKQAAELISDISPVHVETVLDPTLLLNSQNWDRLADEAEIDKKWNVSKPYILCYFVGHRKDYSKYIDLVKKETGMNCIVVPMDVDLSDCGTIATGVGPKEFIWLIKNADIVCTDSFHATVFSIQYQREFYVLKRFDDNSKVSQNGRLYEILDTYNLRDRWITNESVFKREKNIDYDRVYNILNDKRMHSENYLMNALK